MDDVLLWADENRRCGVSRNGLAALALAPTFFETGAESRQTPSPMTLSRYDDQAGLYESNARDTPYPRAFWHPGVGVWQLDSAGLGQPYDSAQRINTGFAANVVTAYMAQVYCNAPGTAREKRRAAWRPWVACRLASDPCESAFQTIWRSPGSLNVTRDASVDRRGGATLHSCYHSNDPSRSTFGCYYVNPSVAQGHTAWRTHGFGPSPITHAFYTYTHSGNGLEYRNWLATDTGYNTGIYARRPLDRNARTSLVWMRNQVLCDVSRNEGRC
ncbi:MAG: hypothetical protein GEU81_06435 [Nitriliruptorales bacterium]|nr:hypothetical protein [Nitriliruptorales bacterium]